jgi:TonB-dependent SusC/RagA subfamily outer membrane receptor
MKTVRCIVTIFLCWFLVLSSSSVFSQAKAFDASQGNYRNILDMLKEVPGVDVKSTTDKTGGSVTIRGVASLATSKNNPLKPVYVVDGAIYTGYITNINPRDVAEISILKDAASGTSYGSQAMGGVILITTKRGINTAAYNAVVSSYDETAYEYFIQHKSKLKVFDWDDKVIIESAIRQQRDNMLVFVKNKKEVLVPVTDIRRVEIVQQ